MANMIPIEIGTRRELFVDSLLVERMAGTRFDLKHPERREAALLCDAPWEDNVASFLSLVPVGNTVRLYYRASIPDRSNEKYNLVAMAESRDGGKSFQRPDLGLVEFGGSKTPPSPAPAPSTSISPSPVAMCSTASSSRITVCLASATPSS